MKPLIHYASECPVIEKHKRSVVIGYIYFGKDHKLCMSITCLVRSDLKTWKQDCESVELFKWFYYEELDKAAVTDARTI